jgi:hypothetical protein
LTGKGTTEEDAGPELASAPTLDGVSSEPPPADESRVEVQAARLGRFVLLRELGAGGMGSVFAAYDEQLDRKVALKILRKTHASTAVQRLRTLREARAAARVSHPNIIAIYEVGEIDGTIHIAMEHVDGGTLRAWQERGRRSWRDILGMYLQIGEALLAAHEAEVVHRDFKPDNVLISWDERPRVVDFGLARLGWGEEEGPPEGLIQSEFPDVDTRNSGRLTLPGVISGTPGYMSPEQYRGGNVDSRSDQWSFCAALYEALYGQLPFSGSTLREHAESVNGPLSPPPPSSQVPAEVRQALVRGLSPDPEQRFPTMAELVEILKRELRGDASSGALVRQRFSRALVIAGFLGLGVFQALHSQLVSTPRAIGPIWPGFIATVLLGGVWYREILLRNRFHRHIWLIVLVTSMLFLLQRLIGSAIGLAFPQMLPFQMAVMAGTLAIAAATLIPELFFVVAISLLACLLSLKTTIPHRVLGLAYPLAVIGLVICWSRAAKKAQRSISEHSADFAAKVRGRSTPSRPSVRSSNDRLRGIT